jgi:regulator of nonsense transcripts 2
VEEDSDSDSAFDEEAIVVTRQEEEVDPEDEADFEREYAKMMAESLESRKFERKQLFDVPLPVRSKTREASSTEGGEGESPPGHTMAFSLLTKRGNRQQTRTVELPSDSTFAVAMKNQQQAEREEQQRIKNLVLNYDLQQSEDQDGGSERPATYYHNRLDRSNKDRGQRSRKLQLSDVDW